MLRLIEAGSWAWKLGRIFLIESTTSMVLVPGWRWMARMTERSSLYQDATLSVWTLSSTEPSCSSLIGEPFR